MQYKFRAVNLKGEAIEGTREAEDQYALGKILKQEGYTVTDFRAEGGKKSLDLSFLNFFNRVPLVEKMIFTRNLAVMISAGLPITRAFVILIKQAKNKKFKKTISELSAAVTKGQNFSDCLAEHKDVFPNIYAAMVRAGEKSGNLQGSLIVLAEQMEKDYTLRRKIKGAMVYPLIVIIAMLIIAILMLIYVVPTLIATFQDLEVQLPASTRIIIWFSDSLLRNSVFIIIGAVVLIVLAAMFLRTRGVKKMLSAIYLRLPVISSLTKKINSARAARTLSSLISSGVAIMEALDISAEVIQNFYFHRVLINAKEEIQKGSPISSAFKKDEKIFPPLMSEMIAVGEETGELPDMLLKLAVFYEEQVGEATKDMASIIEPVLMLFIGLAVGFFAVSMMKPMYSMIGGF